MLIEVFGQLKERVVWKWEKEMKDKPANLFLQKWLPQADILGHHKTKLFVTHGGLNSVEEALYHEVPLVILPGFADQHSNADRAVRQGYGLSLSWTNVTSQQLL